MSPSLLPQDSLALATDDKGGQPPPAGDGPLEELGRHLPPLMAEYLRAEGAGTEATCAQVENEIRATGELSRIPNKLWALSYYARNGSIKVNLQSGHALLFSPDGAIYYVFTCVPPTNRKDAGNVPVSAEPEPLADADKRL